MGFLAQADGGKVFSTKAESKLRWPTLVFVCLSLIGSFYTYDEPAALKTQIMDYMDDPNDYETLFSLLYSVYSFPNIILPFFGGYLVDRFRARNCQVLFSFLALAGNIVFAVGMSTKIWWVMYIGRIMHGCGGISICISALALLAEWFTGKELALAFGCELSVCRLSGVMSNLVNPRVAEVRDVEAALWLGVLMCAVSLVGALMVHPMDRFLEEQLQTQKHIVSLSQDDLAVAAVENPLRSTSSDKQPPRSSHSYASVRESNSELTHVCADANKADKSPTGRTNSADHWTIAHQLSIVDTFSPLFWLLCLICVCVYGCVFRSTTLSRHCCSRGTTSRSSQTASALSHTMLLVSARMPQTSIAMTASGTNHRWRWVQRLTATVTRLATVCTAVTWSVLRLRLHLLCPFPIL